MVLNRLKVGQKVSLIVVTVGLALMLLLVLSFTFFSHQQTGLTRVRDFAVPNALTAKDMAMQVVQVQQFLSDISATRGQDGLDDGYKGAENAYQTFMVDLARLRGYYVNAHDDAGVQATDALKQKMDLWYGTGKQMAAAYIEGGAESGNRLMPGFDKISTELQDALDPVVSALVGHANDSIGSTLAEAGRVQAWIITGIAAIIVILTTGGIWLSRSVAGRLQRLSTSMNEMVRSKDLSAQAVIDGEDEIALVGASFNDLVGVLRTMLAELNRNVAKLDDTTETLGSAVDQASHSSEVSSESAASMAAAVEEVSTSLNQTQDNAQNMLAIVRDASRYSDEGGKVIDQTVREMQKIAQSVLQVSGVISQLGEQTGRISNIVDVIKEVADQTNLLALNAAIEAARAGEAGRGFAVVADEVRKLAERTSQSTAEIGAMIQGIQQSAQSAVGTMDDSVSLANSGAGLAESAGKAINNIRVSTGRVEQVFGEVSMAISEQSAAGQSIAGRVDEVARAAEESRAVTQQSVEVVRTLDVMAGEIRTLVGQFRT
jgi:methyl-accepting chemotaxis protein